MHEKDIHIAACYESKPDAAGNTQRLQIVDKQQDMVRIRNARGRVDTWMAEYFADWAQQRVISLHPSCDLDDTPVPALKQEQV